MKSFLTFVLSAVLSSSLLSAQEPAQVKLTRLPDRVRVEISGKLFTEYYFTGASRPFCYPILAADGTSLVRDFPMKETPGEDTDHPHQRGLMFAHGDVNKIDFWNEGNAGTKFPKGRTVHDQLLETKSGDVGIIQARNHWKAPDGKLIATDETTLKFHSDGDARFLDYEVTVHALPDAPLVMGDNKEGVMAVRVAQWMTMPHKLPGKDVPGVGHILTARGDRDAAAWGTRADWCDYFAEHNGKTYGVAVFDHPGNVRHPTWWMARDYGLLAANPFGQHDFEIAAKHPEGKGDYTIPAGETLTLRYRFYFHIGEEKTANIAGRYADYSKGK